MICKTHSKFIPAKPNELQIDIDNFSDLLCFCVGIGDLRESRHIKIITVERTFSKSGNLHFRIFLARRLPLVERIALQAILGSDRRRELRNWGRAKNNAPYPVLLIERD
jgi:hypothetical protein